MGNDSNDQEHKSTTQAGAALTKALIIWALGLFVPVALLRFSLIPLSPPHLSRLSHFFPVSKDSPSSQGKKSIEEKQSQSFNFDNGSSLEPCNYFEGEWVPEARAPLYNGTSCTTIQEGQNCMAHGRPDTGYLFWRWQPKQCHLPDFLPSAFMELIRNKHIAFVGDSLARNQLESLLCLLSTASPPELVHLEGVEERNRRWVFRTHNATASILWSPFLIKEILISPPTGRNYHELYLDSMDQLWTSQLDEMDVAVFTISQWFLQRAVYLENGTIIGCHYCPDKVNHNETDFNEAFREAVRMALREVSRRWRQAKSPKLLVLVTFSPSHFDADWDKNGGCPKKVPHKEGEIEMKNYEADIRRVQLEELATAAAAERESGGRVRFEALDVTKLSMMRPDGHPGPYMRADPFTGGAGGGNIRNDCLHWCLPGPVDAWNQILLEVIRRWRK